MMNYTFKIKSSVCVLLVALMLVGTSAHAAYEQVGNNSVSVKGTTVCGHAEEVFGVDVWAPEKSLKDLRKEKDREKYTDILVFREQLISGENGEYEFKFDLNENAKNGFYNVVINCACGAEMSEEVFYCNPEDNKKALEELAQKNSAEEVLEYLNGVDENGEANKYKLGFVYDFEPDIYSAEIMLNFIKSREFDAEDKAGAISAYKKSVVLSAVRNGEISDMFEYEDVLGLRTSRIAKFVESGAVTENIKNNTTSRFMKFDVSSFEEYTDVFYECFVLSSVLHTNGYSDIGDIAEEFANEIGLSKRPSDKMCISVMNHDFENYKDLCEALLKSNGNSLGGGSSSGGGSFGGGVSSGGKKEDNGKTVYSQEYVSGEESTKIDSYIFNDIDSVPWAIDAIVELAEQGIINGREQWKFYPMDNILREEVTKLIVEAFLSEETVSEAELSGFTDVRTGEWYEKYINLAYKCGVITGTGEGEFGTGNPITREDMAVIAYRTAIYKGLISEDEVESGYKFSDDNLISDYAKEAVYALENNKVINGVGDGMFAPKDVLTRAQAAKIIYELYTINK